MRERGPAAYVEHKNAIHHEATSVKNKLIRERNCTILQHKGKQCFQTQLLLGFIPRVYGKDEGSLAY
jgi:hypothetical protein